MRYRLLFFETSAELSVEREGALRKRHCMKRSKFVVFSDETSGVKVVGSYRPRSRFERFFGFDFLRV